MAETIGSLTDKISIIQLKIFHMRQQLEHIDTTPDHKAACTAKLNVMGVQLKDLEDEHSQLISDVCAGRVKLKIYRQFKMYNDPRYRSAIAPKK